MTETNGFMHSEKNSMNDTASVEVSTASEFQEAHPADQECADFQALMAQRIGAGEDLQSFPHMLTCDRCRGLVNDLEAIASAARELMPIEIEPRDDLWYKIRDAINGSEHIETSEA